MVRKWLLVLLVLLLVPTVAQALPLGQPVPEPGTVGLLALGLVSLAAYWRNKSA